jgi:hypothetical protein
MADLDLDAVERPVANEIEELSLCMRPVAVSPKVRGLADIPRHYLEGFGRIDPDGSTRPPGILAPLSNALSSRTPIPKAGLTLATITTVRPSGISARCMAPRSIRRR